MVELRSGEKDLLLRIASDPQRMIVAEMTVGGRAEFDGLLAALKVLDDMKLVRIAGWLGYEPGPEEETWPQSEADWFKLHGFLAQPTADGERLAAHLRATNGE
jgi:hypothetical protein